MIDVTPPKAARVDISFGNVGSCTNNVFNAQVSVTAVLSFELICDLSEAVCFLFGLFSNNRWALSMSVVVVPAATS